MRRVVGTVFGGGGQTLASGDAMIRPPFAAPPAGPSAAAAFGAAAARVLWLLEKIVQISPKKSRMRFARGWISAGGQTFASGDAMIRSPFAAPPAGAAGAAAAAFGAAAAVFWNSGLEIFGMQVLRIGVGSEGLGLGS